MSCLCRDKNPHNNPLGFFSFVSNSILIECRTYTVLLEAIRYCPGKHKGRGINMWPCSLRGAPHPDPLKLLKWPEFSVSLFYSVFSILFLLFSRTPYPKLSARAPWPQQTVSLQDHKFSFYQEAQFIVYINASILNITLMVSYHMLNCTDCFFPLTISL